MVIQVVDQRNPISGDGLSHRLKMLKGGLSLDDPRPNDPSGVVIFGENKILLLFCPWKPEMMGGIMLKEGPWSRSFKSRIDLAFLPRLGMIVPIL